MQSREKPKRSKNPLASLRAGFGEGKKKSSCEIRREMGTEEGKVSRKKEGGMSRGEHRRRTGRLPKHWGEA